MRKLLSVLLVLLMALSIVPLAFAEDQTADTADGTDTEGDTSTDDGTDDTSDTSGEDTDVGDADETESDETDADETDAGDETESDETDEADGTVEDESTEDETSEDETDEAESEETEEELEEETQEQAEAVSTGGRGAEVRLLQLEKAILRNIIKGKVIIAAAQSSAEVTEETVEEAEDEATEEVEETETDETDEDETDETAGGEEAEAEGTGSIAELEAIIADMEALKAEVQAADPNAEDAVKVFVALKRQAIDLSKQFRDKARALLGPGKSGKLKQKMAKVGAKAAIKLAKRIKTKVKAFNAEQLEGTFATLGIEKPELLEKVASGEVTLEEAKATIRERMAEMSKEVKREAFKNLKEAGVKKRVLKAAKLERVKETAGTDEEAESEEAEDSDNGEKLKAKLVNRLKAKNINRVKKNSG